MEMNCLRLFPTRYYRAVAAFSVLSLASSSVSLHGLESDDKAPKSIKAADIPKSAVIIGQLGVPLGKIATIRGKWVLSGPKHTMFFQVTSIDGAKIQESCDLRAIGIMKTGKKENNAKWDWSAEWAATDAPPEPVVDEEWELLGFETGGITGYPEAAYKEDVCESLKYIASTGYEFSTVFIFTKMRKIE
jgi:hypothetical protein